MAIINTGNDFLKIERFAKKLREYKPDGLGESIGFAESFNIAATMLLTQALQAKESQAAQAPSLKVIEKTLAQIAGALLLERTVPVAFWLSADETPGAGDWDFELEVPVGTTFSDGDTIDLLEIYSASTEDQDEIYQARSLSLAIDGFWRISKARWDWHTDREIVYQVLTFEKISNG